MYYIIKNTKNPSFVTDGFFNSKALSFDCPVEATEYKQRNNIEGFVLDMNEKEVTKDFVLRFKKFSEYVSELSNNGKKALLETINARTPIKNFI